MTVRELRVFILIFLTSLPAVAQIQNEPVEIVTAPAPTAFSSRAGLWPSDTLPAETFNNDTSTLNDRWNSVPGVQARQNGSPTISIRGSAQADRVLKLFDGAPLNMPDGVGASDLLIPTEVMANASLIKGPASVFYGASAMSGAIDHRLQYFDRPTLEGAIADAGGMFGERRAALIVPVQIGNQTNDPKSHLQFSVLSERDPQNFLYSSTTSSRTARNDGNLKDLMRVTAAADQTVGADFQLSVRAVAAKSVGESSGSLYFPLHSTFNTSASLVSVDVSREIKNKWLASLRIADARLWGLYDESAPTQSTSMTSRTSLFADLDLNLSDTVTLKTFSDVSTGKLTASYVGGSEFYESNADVGQSLEVAISPELSVQPSYRYQSRYGQIFKSLAMIFLKDPATYSFKIGEGFRAASLTDRFANYSTFRGNPGLQPEREWSAELSAGFENGKRYAGFLEGSAVKVSTYYTSYNDLVETQTTGPTFTKANRGEARALGAELGATYGYKIWSASFGYNYLDARNITANEPLRFSPRHQAVATLAQLIGPLILEAKETLWSSFYDVDPSTGSLKELPSWQTLDLTFRTIALTNWEFAGGVLNIFDTSRELTYGYPEPQRRFFLSAKRSF